MSIRWLVLLVVGVGCGGIVLPPESDDELDSVKQAGSSQQGSSQQGSSQQGSSQQGSSQQGTNPAAGIERVRKSGAMLGATPLGSVGLSGTNLVGAITENGLKVMRSGAAMVGSEFTAVRGDGVLVKLRITDHVMDTDPSINMMRLAADHTNATDIHLWRVEFKDDTKWKPLCKPHSKITHSGEVHYPDSERAMFFPGYFQISTGNHIENQPDYFGLACWDGTAAKCARWGYKWWQSKLSPITDQVESLKPLFEACVPAAMADYCGDGYSFTVNGTRIDISDTLGFITKVSEESDWPHMFEDESSWGVSGAKCLDDRRYHDSETLNNHTCATTPYLFTDTLYYCPAPDQLIQIGSATYCPHSTGTTGVALRQGCNNVTRFVCSTLKDCCRTFNIEQKDPAPSWTQECVDRARLYMPLAPP